MSGVAILAPCDASCNSVAQHSCWLHLTLILKSPGALPSNLRSSTASPVRAGARERFCYSRFRDLLLADRAGNSDLQEQQCAIQGRVARFVQNRETVKKGRKEEDIESGENAAGRSACGRGARSKDSALSTGQAARYCYVTSYTIVNWIRSGKLKAQKTAGGQYRIRVGELRDFMRETEMQTDLLDAEENIRPYCWEFYCQLSEQLSACDDCLVHRSGTERCYELRGEVPLSECLFHDCTNCEYYQTWGPNGVRTNALESLSHH